MRALLLTILFIACNSDALPASDAAMLSDMTILSDMTAARDLSTASDLCTGSPSDVDNCGACGHRCCFLCSSGTCIGECPAGLTWCSRGCDGGTCPCDGNGFCANLSSDPSNCGGCTIPCANAQMCIDGECK